MQRRDDQAPDASRLRARRLLDGALSRLGLSARAYDRVLKVARTIADLASRESIDAAHVSEAVQYRALDRAYFRV